MIKVLVADKNYLTRVGIELLISSLKGFNLIQSVTTNGKDLSKKIAVYNPDLLIIDHASLGFTPADIKLLTKKNSSLRILAITDVLGKEEMNSALLSGINSYLLKECDREEIIEAIETTLKGQRFLCGKVASVLTSVPEVNMNRAVLKSFSCEGFTVTERELEIVKLIAEGFSNKQIADKLNLSTHTVNTHRKNIMNKLSVNNTAGIVMFAVKHNLLETNHFLFSN
jgi:DNA-binding NarL/FixJ family response regulator